MTNTKSVVQLTEYTLDGLFRLDDKIALVTGGSTGIGYYAAAALLRAGCAKVIITGRRRDKAMVAAQTLSKISNIKGTAIAMVADCSRTEALEQLAKDVLKETSGKLDILVPNAGTGITGLVDTFSDEKTVEMLDINVRGVFNVIRLMLPMLGATAKPEDPSRVVIVASVGGTTVPQLGTNASTIYATTKAAVQHMARNLALDLAPRHITTNTISPGYVLTEMTAPHMEPHGGPTVVGKSNPMGRLCVEEDIAGVIIYLCSKAGMYANGVDVPLDGGLRLSAGVYG